jgi:hypothetical protein
MPFVIQDVPQDEVALFVNDAVTVPPIDEGWVKAAEVTAYEGLAKLSVPAATVLLTAALPERPRFVRLSEVELTTEATE